MSLSRPGEQFAAEVVNQDGAWTWNELVAPDLAAAVAFYRELLGWGAADIPGAVARTSFSLGELLVGGGHTPIGPEDPTPRWTISFWVADADRCVERARELGGGGGAAAHGHPRRPVRDPRRPRRGGVHR